MDVETGNEESLEEGIRTFEVIQKNPTRREERGIGVVLVSKIVVPGNIFKLDSWRKKGENEQNHHWNLMIAFS